MYLNAHIYIYYKWFMKYVYVQLLYIFIHEYARMFSSYLQLIIYRIFNNHQQYWYIYIYIITPHLYRLYICLNFHYSFLSFLLSNGSQYVKSDHFLNHPTHPLGPDTFTTFVSSSVAPIGLGLVSSSLWRANQKANATAVLRIRTNRNHPTERRNFVWGILASH